MSRPSESARCTGSHVEIAACVEKLAREHREGALVAIQGEAIPRDEALERRAFEALVCAAHARLELASCATTSWLRHEAVIEGSREALLSIGGQLFEALVAHSETTRLKWSVIMTRIFPGEGERTLFCDPGYDLREQSSSALFWVEPCAKPDWRKSQRYPTTTVLRVAARG